MVDLADSSLPIDPSRIETYHPIQFQAQYAQPETPLLTKDHTRAILGQMGCNLVRRFTISLTGLFNAKGMRACEELVKNITGAYALATLGMGNYAAIAVQYVWATRNFLRPDEQGDDIIEAVKKYVGKVGGQRRWR